MKIAIVGAGIAGLSCAQELGRAGLNVRLFDKGRGPGGRMSTRRIAGTAGDVRFDHGAPFFEAQHPDFYAELQRWDAASVAKPWPLVGDEHWVGTPSMNAIVRSLAKDHDVQWSTRVTTLTRSARKWCLELEGGTQETDFDTVISAVPAEQVGALMKSAAPKIADEAQTIVSQPCWTLMLGFAQSLNLTSPIPSDPVIKRALCGNTKPGRGRDEAWVIHASAQWSKDNLERSAQEVCALLLHHFAKRLGAQLPEPIIMQAHRWRYAQPESALGDVLYDHDLGVGACGDWTIGCGVEGAWLSGRALADRIITSS